MEKGEKGLGVDVLLLRYHRKQKGCTWTRRKGKLQQLSQGLLQSGAPRTKGQETSEGWKGAVAVENFSHIREEEKRVIIMDGSVAGPRKKQQFSHVGLISTSVLSE